MKKLLILTLLLGCHHNRTPVINAHVQRAYDEVRAMSEMDLKCPNVTVTIRSQIKNIVTIMRADGCGKSILYTRPSHRRPWAIYTPQQQESSI